MPCHWRQLQARATVVQARPFESTDRKICTSGLVADVINYAIFENRSQGLGATEPRNMAFHIENVHRPYNSLGTTVPHCDKYSR